MHAHAVQAQLDRLGVPVCRTDTAGLGTGVAVTARISMGAVTGHLGGCDLAAVTCVWHRRPSEVDVPDPRDAAEVRAGLGGILACLPHLNHPADMAAAALKACQLAVAGRCGLLVPDTVVGSSTVGAAVLDGSVLVKPMSRQVAGLIVDGDRRGWARPMHLTQRRIDKTCDVRLTVVDHHLFAARITSPHLDWRTAPAACRYEVVSVPPAVAAGVRRLMGTLRLRYGALDFAVDGADRWWFLEVNPNGQWLWIEQATGQPIAAAVAVALSSIRPAGADPSAAAATL